jgi:hypothetical protein
MQLVLRYTHRRRPIISLPFAAGMLQGLLLERLPHNLFTITRAQASCELCLLTCLLLMLKQVEQLKSDNVVSKSLSPNQYSFRDLVEDNTPMPLRSVHDILPSYL